mmetsp:Transcript_19370/g.22553  ORF Transcript_19370/g.22553 Transcript_19370/m.22553 type:complete len:92 (-) Transcript_19370:875-1150(-)
MFKVDKNILTDEDANLSYTLQYPNGTAAPSWITMTVPSASASGHFEFSGAYPKFENALIELRIVGKDSRNQKGYASIYVQTKMLCHSSCNT